MGRSPPYGAAARPLLTWEKVHARDRETSSVGRIQAPGGSVELIAEDLHLRYGESVALRGATLGVSTGEIVAVVGESGSGKTSLLYCLAALITPNRGRIHLDGTEITKLHVDAAAELRRSRFGFVFQFGELVPELTIAENIALPLEMLRLRRRVVRRRVDELIEQLGIGDLRSRRPAQVSGGEAQRAAVARAVAHRPDIVFADEPTGALDRVNGDVVLGMLTALARENGSAVVLVTHSAAVAAAADRIVTVVDGRCNEPAIV